MATAIQSSARYPIRASYGEKDHEHALLGCSDDPKKLPSSLMNLTGRPGMVRPEECWWPCVGCGPVDDWWAIWWTMPDDSTTRSGMVKSELALWPIDVIGSVADLLPVITEINGGQPLVTPPDALFSALLDALIQSPSGSAGITAVPVMTDLVAWPGLLIMLWRRLWPQARQHFSARVAVSPPQRGELVPPPLLYITLAGRVNEWHEHLVVVMRNVENVGSRAARWLMGAADAAIAELLDECPITDGLLSSLRRYARTADALERIQHTPNVDDAVASLRSLIALAPSATSAVKQKRTALALIRNTLPEAQPVLLLGLGNIKAAACPPGEIPLDAVTSWLVTHLPQMIETQVPAFLDAYSTPGLEAWWLEAVRAALISGLRQTDARWSGILFLCACCLEQADALMAIASTVAAAEARVLEGGRGRDIASRQCAVLQKNCQALQWSAAHAWALLRQLPPLEAIKEQLAFTPDAKPGLELLATQIPGPTLIAAVIALGNDVFLEIVAQRTAGDLSLMQELDLRIPAWCRLWCFHVAAGGQAWPAGIDPQKEMQHFLRAVIAGQHSAGVMKKLAVEFAEVTFQFNNRAALWKKLDLIDATALVEQTAHRFLKACNQGEQVSMPEPFLRAVVFANVDKVTVHAHALITLLSWDAYIEENTAQRWIKGVQDWGISADNLGELVFSKQWRQVARDLYLRYTRGDFSVGPALQKCLGLLNPFSKAILVWRLSSATPEQRREAIVHCIAEIGSEVAPDRVAEIWVRAGGSRGRLRNAGSGSEQWRDAVTQAAQGGLKDGALAIVEELLQDYPHNQKLIELRDALCEPGNPRKGFM